MSDTEILFQELSSTYREYFTMFFQITGLYVAIIGVLVGISARIFLGQQVDRNNQIKSLLIVVFFLFLISAAYSWALYYAFDETKTLEDNIQKISNSVSLSPKVQMPRLLSKVIIVMRVVSGIIILGAFGIRWFVPLVQVLIEGRSKGNTGEKLEQEKNLAETPEN